MALPFVYQILERYGNDLINLNLLLLQVVGGKWRVPWSSHDCYLSMDCTDLVYYLMDDSISTFIVFQLFLFFCFFFHFVSIRV